MNNTEDINPFFFALFGIITGGIYFFWWLLNRIFKKQRDTIESIRVIILITTPVNTWKPWNPVMVKK
jgi:hypothetical protein